MANYNIFDYLKWRGDLTFEETGLNEVDNLILANFSYIRFTYCVPSEKSSNGISLKEAARLFFAEPKERQIVRDKNDYLFFKELAASKRFGDLILFYHHEVYDKEKEIQFGAISIDLGNGEYYISYRGTDNAVIGWKEDLDLVFKVVPAQIEAANYLNDVASIVKGKLHVGGHSKGGNLAVYAASHCLKKHQKRILRVYNNDGPGFDSGVISGDVVLPILDRLVSYVPKTSMVGMVMKQYGKQIVVDSSNIGIMQHDPYSWKAMGGHFIIEEKRDAMSVFVETTLSKWFSKIDHEDRRTFVDGVFLCIAATHAEEIKDILPGLIKNFKEVQTAMDQMDQKTKEAISLVFKELWSAASSTLGDFFKKDEVLPK